MSSSEIPSALNFHSNGGTYPPHGLITPDNHGPRVVVTTWIMMCLMSLTLIARLATRRDSGKGNMIITTAAVRHSYKCCRAHADTRMTQVISVAQSAVTHIAVDYGLGRHRMDIGTSHYHIYSKACIVLSDLRLFIPLTLSLGEIRRSDTRNYDTMPGKDFVGGRLYAVDTLEASRHGTSSLHGVHRVLGPSSDICTRVSMSEAGYVGSHAE